MPDKSIRVWRRSACGGTLHIALPAVDGSLERNPHDFERVVVSGHMRHRRNAALITLFLVNEETAPEQNLDEAWLFQAPLAVRAPDDGVTFLDRATAAAGLAGSLDPDEHEARSLAMPYRSLWSL